MPLVRISVDGGWSRERLGRLSDAIHRALVDAAKAPAEGKFQIVTEHAAGGIVHPPAFQGIPKTDGIVIVQITMNAGRAPEVKRGLYAALAANCREAAGVDPDDLVVSLVEVPKENWSWGRGVMTYAPE